MIKPNLAYAMMDMIPSKTLRGKRLRYMLKTAMKTTMYNADI